MKYLVIAMLFMLTGCGDDGVPQLKKEVPIPAEKVLSTRFTVESQGRFDAGYGSNTREILIITDTKTKRQYLAITGCGTTELMQETVGKTTITKEE